MNTSTSHTNALEAWNYLCTHGGLEVEGRDEGFAEKLHELINPSASSLEEAIKSASMEIFLSAFFRSVHPYLSMFEDILAFFKQASATKGQDQWTLHVGDIGIDLDHFREYTETWSSLGKSVVMFHGIDYESAWKIHRCFNWRNLVSDGITKESESAWAHPIGLPVKIDW